MTIVFPSVLAVAADPVHGFSKPVKPKIRVIEGLGVEGDAHFGKTVQHLSRIKADPSQPNLRQVHLIATELFDEMATHGYALGAGQLGDNILTSGIDLINLPRDTRLTIGRSARLRVTGLRNPCAQIENYRPGLLAHMIEKLSDGRLLLKTGIMAVVEQSGTIRPGDRIMMTLPELPHIPLERV